MFAGKKTYIMAGVAVITAVAAWLVGEADLQTTANAIFAALMAAFIRHGISTAAAAPKE
jgi:hypothetical protein